NCRLRPRCLSRGAVAPGKAGRRAIVPGTLLDVPRRGRLAGAVGRGAPVALAASDPRRADVRLDAVSGAAAQWPRAPGHCRVADRSCDPRRSERRRLWTMRTAGGVRRSAGVAGLEWLEPVARQSAFSDRESRRADGRASAAPQTEVGIRVSR